MKPTPLWRVRDYLLLWGGQIVSLVGTSVSQLAFPLLTLALTGVLLQRFGALVALGALVAVLLTLALVVSVSPSVRAAQR